MMSTEGPVETVRPEAGDDRIQQLASEIDIYSLVSIQKFGTGIAERAADHADAILGKVRAGELDNVGRQLNEIVLTAQSVDVDCFDRRWSSIPIIDRLVRNATRVKERAVARFDTVRAQIDKLVAQVETAAAALGQTNDDHEAMYQVVHEEHGELGRHIDAIVLKLDELEAALAAPAGDAKDLVELERRAVLEASKAALAKRADDLRALQHSALQTLPMIRIVQSNNLALIDKFQAIRQLTLPAWKRAFLLMLALDEQKKAVELTSMIDDTTNDLMRRNADLLRDNAIATAQSTQRMIIDVDTLRHVHDQVLTTLCDLRDMHQSAADKRRTALKDLARLRAEMIAGTKQLEAPGGD